MYTIEMISKILEPVIVQQNIESNDVINDFEINLKEISNSDTALINISEESWLKWYNFKKSRQSNKTKLSLFEDYIPLVISDEFLPEDYYGNVIIVKNTFEAMFILASYFRERYKNPLIAITGSFGKSSTRLMLETVLDEYKVVHNKGNANMRIPVLLNLCKLVANPDFALFEVSLNALNNKGNMSNIMKPDIAIVTGIGEAHLSTIGGTKEIAKFKARLFEGLSSNGLAIINADTLHADFLISKAANYTKNIETYSIEKPQNQSTFFIEKIETLKGQVNITLTANGSTTTYTLNSISRGMVYNSLAVILALNALKVDLRQSILKLANFRPLKKVLEFKEITYQNEIYTLIDDTHNASLPAMINAIETFNNQARFFKGSKVIAIGKINDLGENTYQLHSRLVPLLKNSEADYILCLDDELKPVVNKIKGKTITWYNDYQLLVQDLCTLLTPNSLTLLKSSVTGTVFPKVAQQLPRMIKSGFTKNKPIFHTKATTPAFTFIPKNHSESKVIFSQNSSIEGLAPLFYYIYAQSLKIKNYSVEYKQWPTNNNKYYKGKTIMLYELIQQMINQPHPSSVYQLAHELFENEKDRIRQFQKFIQKYGLSTSSIINVTGRYMSKERHRFTHQDLYKLYEFFEEQLFMKQENICFGYETIHGILKTADGIIIFTSYPSKKHLQEDLSNIIDKINI